jgi:hypothetical protein
MPYLVLALWITLPLVKGFCRQMCPVRLSVTDRVASSVWSVTKIAALLIEMLSASALHQQNNDNTTNDRIIFWGHIIKGPFLSRIEFLLSSKLV